MANPDASIVVGIDVGGTKKGFHVVALRDGKLLDRFTSPDPKEVAAWCRRIGAHAVGVDAPCRWSDDGYARPAERQLMHAGIHCFASPTRAAAVAHPKSWYGWMLAGEALYAALRHGYRLAADPVADALSVQATSSPVVFETFPQAIACSLAGRHVPARDKSRARREVLRAAGIDPSPFTNIDWVDAALCALSAAHFAAGTVRWYGEALPDIRPGPGTGHIIVPLGTTRIDAALIRAYRATRHGVDADAAGRDAFALQVDVPSAALLALYAQHRVTEAAYLTACNPESRRLPDAENRRRMAALAGALRAAGSVKGWPVLAGRAEDPSGQWPAEPSLLALGVSEAEARRLGAQFGQNAVLHARRDGVPRLVLLR